MLHVFCGNMCLGGTSPRAILTKHLWGWRYMWSLKRTIEQPPKGM